LQHEWARRALEATEEYLEGRITPQEAAEAYNRFQEGLKASIEAYRLLRGSQLGGPAEGAVLWASLPLNPEEPELERVDRRWRPFMAAEEAADYASRSGRIAEEPGALATLLRDIFPSPFRPSPSNALAVPGGLGETVRTLTQAAYEHRLLPSGELDPARLTVLVDALLAAGYTEGVLLDHLRGPGPHVRGCFAVDWLLGRA